ncbi:MAG: redoxin domain-containing protein [Verrucomicrobia bacterium]|nr:redoxin domain-containing protein [Verrucomicrobiota bacterium]
MNRLIFPRCLAATVILAVACFNPCRTLAQPDSPKIPGSPWPEWELTDFQPKSPRFNETYGLDHFRGRVTFVALLATWCGFCKTQIEKMEEMRKEFAANRIEVNFVVVNITSGESEQNEFISRSSFPLFQDTALVDAFTLHKGGKDDYYIYNERGELTDFFAYGGDRESNLATAEGFANLKQAVLDAPFRSRASVDTVAAVTIDGVAGRTYRIDFSEDLGDSKNWTPLKTVTIDADQYIYVDLKATRLRKHRFYQVEEVP